MRILVDGDGCPVIDIIQQTAELYQIELIVYTDLNHKHNLRYGKLITVDQGYQSVDMELYNNIKEDDIVITSDYGLAALALSRKAEVISFSGREFTDENIERLLLQRHIHLKERRKTGRHTTHKKRTTLDDKRFKKKIDKKLSSQKL
ncbi:MAG: YaiI/YqxD family protein [Halanaerobium sp.]